MSSLKWLIVSTLIYLSTAYPLQEELPTRGPFATDEAGRVIYPITWPNGKLLNTDDSDNYVLDDDSIIQKDDYGKPMGPDGEVLPTDKVGNYIHPYLGKNGEPLPTDINNRPIYPIVSADGTPFPTDASGVYVKSDGSRFVTDSSGQPLDNDNVPLPTDSPGSYVAWEKVLVDGSVIIENYSQSVFNRFLVLTE